MARKPNSPRPQQARASAASVFDCFLSLPQSEQREVLDRLSKCDLPHYDLIPRSILSDMKQELSDLQKLIPALTARSQKLMDIPLGLLKENGQRVDALAASLEKFTTKPKDEERDRVFKEIRSATKDGKMKLYEAFQRFQRQYPAVIHYKKFESFRTNYARWKTANSED